MTPQASLQTAPAPSPRAGQPGRPSQEFRRLPRGSVLECGLQPRRGRVTHSTAGTVLGLSDRFGNSRRISTCMTTSNGNSHVVPGVSRSSRSRLVRAVSERSGLLAARQPEAIREDEPAQAALPIRVGGIDREKAVGRLGYDTFRLRLPGSVF